MKQHLIPDDFSELSNTQKQLLRDWWIPEKNELAAALICTDIENDTYEAIEFVIGEVLVEEINSEVRREIHKIPSFTNKYHNMILRCYSLADLSGEETTEAPSEEDEAFSEEASFDYELEQSQLQEYFNKDDCLPLLSIGQLTELLQKVKYGQDGFNITISGNSSNNEYILDSFQFGQQSSAELCDVLWSALKQYL